GCNRLECQVLVDCVEKLFRGLQPRPQRERDSCTAPAVKLDSSSSLVAVTRFYPSTPQLWSVRRLTQYINYISPSLPNMATGRHVRARTQNRKKSPLSETRG